MNNWGQLFYIVIRIDLIRRKCHVTHHGDSLPPCMDAATNTFVLSFAYLTLTQFPPSPFDPGQGFWPVQAAPIAVAPSAAERGGTFRLTDDEPPRPAAPATQSPEPFSQLRPSRNLSTAQVPVPNAARDQAEEVRYSLVLMRMSLNATHIGLPACNWRARIPSSKASCGALSVKSRIERSFM